MKILMLTDVFFPDTIGGAGKVAYNLSIELGNKDHEVHIISRNPGKNFPEQQKLDSNVFIHRFLTPEKESFSLLLMEIINSYPLSKRISQDHFFDIICIHQSMAAIGPLLSKRFPNTPIIYYFHSPWCEEFITKKESISILRKRCRRFIATLMRLWEKRLINKSTKIITLSKYMRDRLTRLHGCSIDKVKIIPGGIDLASFSINKDGIEAIRKEKNIPSNKIVFLTVRNLVKRMGLKNLIEAFHQSDLLKEKSILMIGGKGPLENFLKSLISKYGLEDIVRLTGYIPEVDLSEYYRAADYFVLPTENLEGFGLVILESMACGTPVIGTPVGAIPELITEFDKRLLTKGTSSSDIREKLEEVVKNQDEYSFDSRTCRKFVEDSYSWKKVADEFEKVALELVKNKKPGSPDPAFA